ncbi:cytochrome c maturation protein CcmE [Octadecabacter sp. 1_MG-2023]|uniref:cytochrome c maturation protein CcmE n=1 Tax=unclassified Octadecabacter TaxID=196158 RepID=UPI001C08FBC8|nr:MULTISPECIES: cytochrome c maturation protein CcmE [unclassified Octadecabacter]MBU2993455.1 cytochrome c maturation protein CcmE [Octadecabacter sp. B2R22]MDO6733089.1 cytochrome c maturation protein CcmE [Octadecabacter sp. 1_MG-2023]
MAGFKNLKKTRRKQVLGVAFLALGGVFAILVLMPKDAFQYFRSPTEVVETPPIESELFRIGGMVQSGSIVRGEGTVVSFVVTDCFSAVPVTFDGILPSLFEEGQGMVGQGHYIDGTFQAVEILAKHDETYMPAEVENMHEQQNYCDTVETGDTNT